MNKQAYIDGYLKKVAERIEPDISARDGAAPISEMESAAHVVSLPLGMIGTGMSTAVGGLNGAARGAGIGAGVGAASGAVAGGGLSVLWDKLRKQPVNVRRGLISMLIGIPVGAAAGLATGAGVGGVAGGLRGLVEGADNFIVKPSEDIRKAFNPNK